MQSPPGSNGGRRFFIVAGTDAYLHLGEATDLPSVVGDLDRISGYFDSQGCIRALPELDLNPGLEDIRGRIPVWMQQEVKEDDIVAFYYSGHGKAGSRYYLLLQDSKEGLLSTTAIPVQELAHWLIDGSAARQIVIIIDACYAGLGTGELAEIAEHLANALVVSPCVFAIAAAGARETAQEGTFSQALCDALANRDGSLGWRTQPYIFAEALIDAVNDRLRNAPFHQSARLISNIRESCKLFRNPQYRASVPADLDLQMQRDLVEHWIPKARGAGMAGDAVWYFTGRQRALSEIIRWLETPEGDLRMRVVTGRPGVGKSALIGRLVTLSDPATRGEAIRSVGPASPIPSEGMVQVAIHARRRTLQNIVDLLGARTGNTVSDAETLVARLADCGRIVVAIDAVDEAIEPERIIARLLKPLSHLANVRLLVAMRPDSPSGHVMAFGNNVVEIDLSAAAYFELDDILSYVRQRIEGADARLGATDPGAREQLARSISAKAGNVFLIARILCDSAFLAERPGGPPESTGAAKESTISGAFAAYLSRLDATQLEHGRATELLMPLAFAEGEGLPWETIWPRLASALSSKHYGASDIHTLLAHAGAYIVEGNFEGRSVYRLYHEALAEYLRGLVDRTVAQRAIVETLTELVPTLGASAAKNWQRAHPYVLRHLAAHAANADRLEALVCQTEFLLHATPQTLALPLRALPYGAADGRAAAYLRAYPHMQRASLPTRVQYLALSAALLRCGSLLNDLGARKAECDWFPKAAWYRDTGSHVIASVSGCKCACLVHTRDNITRLALVTHDSIRILSLSTGEAIEQVEFVGERVSSVVEIPDSGDIVLALAYKNGEIAVFNVTRRAHFKVKAAAHAPRLCVIGAGADQMLVTGDDEGTLTAWSIPHLQRKCKKKAYKAAITALAAGPLEGRALLITGCDAYKDGRVDEQQQLRVWDSKTFDLVQSISGPEGGFVEWCAPFELAGKAYVAAFYFPGSSFIVHALETAGNVAVLADVLSCPFGILEGRDAVALLSGFADEFRWVQVAAGAGHLPEMEATASIPVEGGLWLGPIVDGTCPSVVSVGNDVRVWDLWRLRDRAKAGMEARVGMLDETGEPLFCLSAPSNSRYFGGLSRYGNFRVWSAEGHCIALRQLVTSLENSDSEDYAYLQMVDFGGKCVYALAGRSGAVRAWYTNGEPVGRSLKIDAGYVSAFCLHAAGCERLLAIIAATNGEDCRISAWDLLEGREVTVSGRFQFEDYDDKTIGHLVALEDNGQILIMGALKHAYYHRICAWELDGPVVEEKIQEVRERYGLPRQPRKVLWTKQVSRQIECISTTQCQGIQAMAVGDNDGWITVLRASDGEYLTMYKAHDRAVVAVGACKIDGTDIVVSAGLDGRITIADLFDQSSDRERRFSIDVGDRINAMAVVSGGLVIVGTGQGFISFELDLAALSQGRLSN
ncbi:hypothetical protein WL18_05770 [Burkholderia ubonensis]|uniref:caspase family protein n=1 Tax=Burkholderia ubonensis TaxID=101571 RepID=UPI0007606101|nr:caspase family protein [Burkholderia ubonensis]KVZ49649.1 hypothetical protein WL18_05770 [Burkholderia ubonensis]